MYPLINLLERLGIDARSGRAKVKKNVVVALADSDAAAGVLKWLNNTGHTIYVSLILNVTTKSTAACTVDAGVGNGAASNDTLIDGLDVGTAAIVGGSLTTAGVNGKAFKKVLAGEYVVVSKATGAAAGLVGKAIIEYMEE